MNNAAVAGHNVFVYGSLLADDVVRALLNRVPQSAYAFLPDLFSVKDRVYPAILPVEGEKVSGKVLLGITDPELYVLDVFEDVEYERKTMEVLLADRSEKLQAETYIWLDKEDPNLYGSWDFEEWKRRDMEGFIKMTKEFAEEMELPESKTRVATNESFYREDDASAPTAS